MPTITVTLSNSQYKDVVFISSQMGLTVEQYAKRRIIDDQFCQLYYYLIQKTKKLPIGSRFRVMDLFPNWHAIPRSTRMSLGLHFYHLVNRGGINGIILRGKNKLGTQLYEITSINSRIRQTILLYISAYGHTNTRNVISIMAAQFSTSRQRISGNISYMVNKLKNLNVISNKPNSIIY